MVIGKNDWNVINWSILWLMIKPFSVPRWLLRDISSYCELISHCDLFGNYADITISPLAVVFWGWFGLTPTCEQFVYMCVRWGLRACMNVAGYTVCSSTTDQCNVWAIRCSLYSTL